ncbi:hypothetical protein TruAng_010064 [Truncatella angustata]|nr:hypothetical protein TruAng_010064 [Truncatella angustata]
MTYQDRKALLADGEFVRAIIDDSDAYYAQYRTGAAWCHLGQHMVRPRTTMMPLVKDYYIAADGDLFAFCAQKWAMQL